VTALVAVLTVASAAFFVPGAHAAQRAFIQVLCDHSKTLLEHLHEHFGETPAQAGIVEGGALGSLTLNAETGSWSWVVRQPNGMACLYASGKDWHDAPAAKEREPEM